MNDMPEQQEWWETDLRRMFHGVWAASPHNEQRMTDAAIEAIKPIFARHRELIVKEIRKEILHRATLRVQPVLELDGSRKSDDFYNAVYQILSLPCLKENE